MESNWVMGDDRRSALEIGERKLRTHLPMNAPIKLTLIFGWETKRWEVLTEFHKENHKPILLGRDDLETFPSDEIIAQAVLVA
jgi:hypothetical protein